MSRKITRLFLALTSFLVIIAAVTPAGNTVTWSGETRLTIYERTDDMPSIIQMKDGRIWVVWESTRIGSWNFEIFYTIYDWSSWSYPLPLVTDPNHDIGASVMQTNDDTIWLFFASIRTGNYELFYKNSSDNGETWSNATQLTENPEDDLHTSIIQDENGTIWVVWDSSRTGNYELFYKNSSDNGETWSNATPLTTNDYNDAHPSIAQMRDGTIWVVWHYFTGTKFKIFYKTYNGSWSNATQITEDTPDHDYNEFYPSIMQARDGTIWVLWSEELSGGPDPPLWQNNIYHKTSVDNGATWSEDTELTTDKDWNEDGASAAQISDKRIWLVWSSDKDDNYNIYCQNSSEILFHDVAITSVTPNSTMVEPNGTVSISVAAENQGDHPENFTVNLYVNMTPIGSENVTLSSGNSTTTVFSWNTTGFAPGPYTITANASAVPDENPVNLDDNTFTDGTVTIINHDVAIINVTLSSTSIYQGNPLNIYVEVKNEGDPSETFNVTVYANFWEPIAIQTLTVTDLAPNDNTTLTFTWNTTGVPYGNYTMSATAEPVPGEIDTVDNTLVDGTVFVTIPGDIDVDGDVDFYDFSAFGDAYGSKEGDPNYISGADIDVDGDVDRYDFGLFADNFGRHV